MHILLVEDDPSSLRMMARFMASRGHKVHEAVTAEEGLALYQREPIDLAVLDVMLPGMDGKALVRRIRELPALRWVPVLFVSALTYKQHVIEALEAGGDDYLEKPVDLALLEAKIRAYERMVTMQAELAESNRGLALYREQSEQEQLTAFEILDRLLANEQLDHPDIAYWHQPSARFSGDILAVRQDVGGRLLVLAGDSCGHGLAAALPLIGVSPIFYSMAEQGYSMAAILSAMNEYLYEKMPVDRFMAATVISVDARNRTLEVWNGGNPAAVYVNARGEVLERFPSRSTPLGVQPNAQVDLAPVTYHWREPGCVVSFSDGVTEAAAPDGEVFGAERLEALFPNVIEGCDIDAVAKTMNDWVGADGAHDDMSLVAVRCELPHP